MTWGFGSSSSRKEASAAKGSDHKDSYGPLKLKNDLRVLVVDDNKVNRKLLMMMLSWAKVKALEVENGKEAVDLHVVGEAFHLIFMDMQMPVMDGPEATRMLRSMGVHTTIVGVSGNCRESDKEGFMAAGLDEFYVKPLHRDAMSEILRRVDDEISNY